MSKSSKEIKLEKIKTALTRFELLAPGRLRETLMICGNKSCACRKNKKARHGPYRLWDRKVKGKLTSKMISEQHEQEIKEWIEQRKHVEKLLADAIKLSQEIILEKINASKNSNSLK